MIYADANGSLPPLPEVREHIRRRLDSTLWANPGSIHSLGMKLNEGLEKCRTIVADALGCDPAHVLWNSGASEGISTVFHSVLIQSPAERRLIYLPGTEHAAVVNLARFYEKNIGFEVKMIPVSPQGVVDLAWLKKELGEYAPQTAIIACMAANNETGVVEPWMQIRDLAQSFGIPFFCDTTQWIGRHEFDVLESGLDYAIVAGHKIGALPGAGCLLARDPGAIWPIVFGGGQEQGLRGGTQNYLSIETLAIACDGIKQKLGRVDELVKLRADFERELIRRFPQVVIIAADQKRLPGTSLIGHPGLHGQAVQIELESQDIFVTTSAACSDNEPATSKVLQAMNVEDTLGRSVIRISLPLTATANDYQGLLGALTHAYEKLARIKAY